ncbi:hypothetical protein [Pseudobacteriovorax antillogorgiicola]|uniref:Uncharacterized protein n=1 Tax=Pseudobacteriovorax antillogorgiicola TaxID=1513793 RepID=A0A1Y6CM25_9BACT|nr:hypothetical protein [Pseudobacteriovorax antillogorgiicola]TCS45656.1 hypothetical protein EDD56_12749 [Pseudobacteriovorax antillogorgiicola]SMF72938.1 hypothetical protein SAMN06296036_12748 [Pseudobacteriovorax antillogorgiicola]
MNQMICFRHPEYAGDETPELKCQCCCKIYVDRIREENHRKKVDIDQWLTEKSRSNPKLRVARIQTTQYCPFSC